MDDRTHRGGNHGNRHENKNDEEGIELQHTTTRQIHHKRSVSIFERLNEMKRTASSSYLDTNDMEAPLVNVSRPLKERFHSVDFYSTLSFPLEEDEYDDENFLIHNSVNGYVASSKSCVTTATNSSRTVWHIQKLRSKMETVFSCLCYPIRTITKGIQVKSIIFLVVLGVVASLITLSIDTCIYRIEYAHIRIASLTRFYIVNYILYAIFAVISSLFAAACVHFISQNSAGSGLPEMKSILAGHQMERYLTFRTMVGKALGIIAGLGAGLQIGRLGPFVHVSSCIANMLLKIRFFRKLKKREIERTNMLSAACASGVASTFGSPIGGVLFSIEVTSSAYLVSNLWRCIVVTLFGSLFFYIWRKFGIINVQQISLFSTDFPPFPYELHEILLFILLGIICGFLGAFFNYLVTKLLVLRKSTPLLNKHRYFLVGSAALIIALISFPANPLMRSSPNYSINLLFETNDLKIPHPFINLSVVTIAKFFLTPVSLALPIPCGLFVPVFATGAFMGRLFGEVIRLTIWGNTIPAYYAVVGASALSVGVTRAMSTIVVVFELTGQLSLMLPVILASLFAVGVANFFNESIYDRLMKLRGLPVLNDIAFDEKNSKVLAKDVMRTEIHCIGADDPLESVEKLLSKTGHSAYPVIDNRESMILVGSVRRKDLEIAIANSKLTSPTDELEEKAENELEIIQAKGEVKHRIKDSKSFSGPVNVGSFAISVDNPPTLILKPSSQSLSKIVVSLDPAPMAVSYFTPLTKIYFLFSMLRLSHAFVTVAGKLVGVIAKKDLIILSEN
jgi:H+/Cl- antiporter ClcA